MEKTTLRLPTDLMRRVDNLAPAVKAGRPEIALKGSVTRSDVLRLAILEGVRDLEDELDVDPEQTDITESLNDED